MLTIYSDIIINGFILMLLSRCSPDIEPQSPKFDADLGFSRRLLFSIEVLVFLIKKMNMSLFLKPLFYSF